MWRLFHNLNWQFIRNRDWSANERNHANCLRFASGKSKLMKSTRMYCANVRATTDAPSYIPTSVSFSVRTTSKTTYERSPATVYRTFTEHDNDFNVNICKIQQQQQKYDAKTTKSTIYTFKTAAAAMTKTSFFLNFLCSKIL